MTTWPPTPATEPPPRRFAVLASPAIRDWRASPEPRLRAVMALLGLTQWIPQHLLGTAAGHPITASTYVRRHRDSGS